MNEYLNLRKTPMLRLLFIFMPGILITFRYLNFLSEYVFILLTTVIVLTLLLLFIRIAKLTSKLQDFLIHILVFTISILITVVVLPNRNFVFDNTKIYQAKVYDSPQLKNMSILVPVEITEINSSGYAKCFKVNVYLKKDSTLTRQIGVGDSILFKGNIERVKNRGNPGEFDYMNFMASKGIFFHVWVKPGDVKILNTASSKRGIRPIIELIKQAIDNRTEKFIHNTDSRALIVAFITGDRTLISDEMRDSYVHAGVIHILSVSGLHIGIIFMIFNFLLKPFDYNSRLRFIKTFIIIFAVWFYALISGLSTSVLRSAIMFSLISAGQSFRRDISFYNILAASALIMLLFNPLQLFDIGFQLSYLAVAGIVYFQPKLDKLFTFSNKVSNYVYQLFIVSFAAQLATFPLLLFYFNQFSVYFWLANLLVIPLTFVLMILIVVFLFTSFLPFFGSIFGTICSSIALILNKYVMLIEDLPGSVLENIFISKSEVILCFLLMIFFTLWLERKNAKSLTTSLAIINLILINILIINRNKNEEVLTIYNTPGQATIGIFSNSKGLIFSNASNEKSFSGVQLTCEKHWRRFNKKDKIQITSLDSISFKLSAQNKNPKIGNAIIGLGKSLRLIVYDRYSRLLNDSLISRNDILLVAGNFSPPEKRIVAKDIVFSSGISRYNTQLWKDYAIKYSIEYFDVREKGAWFLKLK